MNQMTLWAAVKYQIALEGMKARLEEERGEISSWLILAAGLALVAIFIGDELYDFANTRLDQIRNSSNKNG